MTITPEREREENDGWFDVQPLYGPDLLSSYKAMREALVKIRDGAWVEQDGSVSDAALDIQHLAKLALQPFTKPAQSKGDV